MAASQPSLSSLPDNIVLEILSYLTVKELCSAGGVCRRWRRITSDNALWRHVDLSDYKLRLQQMWKVIRAHFSPALLSIQIRGFMDKNSGTSRSKQSTLSTAMLQDLKKRCPNIHTLCMYHCYTNNLDAVQLPNTLHTLVINHSSWKPKWLDVVMATKSLPNLTHLDVSGCVRFDHIDLSQISGSGLNLKVLKLNGCYRIAECGFTDLAAGLPGLEVLEVSEVNLTPLACHHIGRNLKRLKRLNLQIISSLTDAHLSSITAATSDLEYLDISHCDQITDAGLKALKHLKRLQTLIICGKFEKEGVKILKVDLPLLNVEIV